MMSVWFMQASYHPPHAVSRHEGEESGKVEAEEGEGEFGGVVSEEVAFRAFEVASIESHPRIEVFPASGADAIVLEREMRSKRDGVEQLVHALILSGEEDRVKAIMVGIGGVQDRMGGDDAGMDRRAAIGDQDAFHLVEDEVGVEGERMPRMLALSEGVVPP